MLVFPLITLRNERRSGAVNTNHFLHSAFRFDEMFLGALGAGMREIANMALLGSAIDTLSSMDMRDTSNDLDVAMQRHQPLRRRI
jgi:hypothetical protein